MTLWRGETTSTLRAAMATTPSAGTTESSFCAFWSVVMEPQGRDRGLEVSLVGSPVTPLPHSPDNDGRIGGRLENNRGRLSRADAERRHNNHKERTTILINRLPAQTLSNQQVATVYSENALPFWSCGNDFDADEVLTIYHLAAHLKILCHAVRLNSGTVKDTQPSTSNSVVLICWIRAHKAYRDH